MQLDTDSPTRHTLPVPSPRQTLSYLRGLFEAHGLEAKSKLGQNFLIDLNLLDLIVRTAELDQTDAVLEVGTGTGSLTARLAEQAGAVVTVEIDTVSHRSPGRWSASGRTCGSSSATAWRSKNELNPDMLAAWDEAATRARLHAAQARREPALRDRHAAHQQPAHRARPTSSGWW